MILALLGCGEAEADEFFIAIHFSVDLKAASGPRAIKDCTGGGEEAYPCLAHFSSGIESEFPSPMLSFVS